VAVRAQKAKILLPTVGRITIDVVNMEDQGLSLPHLCHRAKHASIRNATLQQCSSEKARLAARMIAGNLDQYFVGSQPWSMRARVMAFAAEVGSVELKTLDAPAHMRMRATCGPNAERAQHAGYGDTRLDGTSEVRVGIRKVSRHA
jgi:hypothetical protein